MSPVASRRDFLKAAAVAPLIAASVNGCGPNQVRTPSPHATNNTPNNSVSRLAELVCYYRNALRANPDDEGAKKEIEKINGIVEFVSDTDVFGPSRSDKKTTLQEDKLSDTVEVIANAATRISNTPYEFDPGAFSPNAHTLLLPVNHTILQEPVIETERVVAAQRESGTAENGVALLQTRLLEIAQKLKEVAAGTTENNPLQKKMEDAIQELEAASIQPRADSPEENWRIRIEMTQPSAANGKAL